MSGDHGDFPGTVLCWCLGFGRVLVKKTQDDSKKLLLNAFGKQPRYVWLYRDGAEVQIALDRLEPLDVIVVNTGEVVPVDGIIAQGMAMIDQHALTGESTPAEKGVGDRVFAATLMVAGKILVQVEKSGNETASAKISQILNDTAGYKLSSQHKGERLADKAVIPTLAVGAVGMAAMGPGGAVAVLNSDFGTGIRMAAPLAMLSSLALCANKGILVKDGRALELMNEVDTVLFDKTGTLTRERPEVGRMIASHGFASRANPPVRGRGGAKVSSPDRAGDSAQGPGAGPRAAADGRHAVQGRLRHHGRSRGPHDPRRQQAIHGLGGRGRSPPKFARPLEQSHLEGHTMVMVSVDGRLGGAIELHAAVGPRSGRSSKGFGTAASSTSPSSRATMRPPPASWPSRWAWTVTSPRSCPPTRPTM